jgi:hypothetical protein
MHENSNKGLLFLFFIANNSASHHQRRLIVNLMMMKVRKMKNMRRKMSMKRKIMKMKMKQMKILNLSEDAGWLVVALLLCEAHVCPPVNAIKPNGHDGLFSFGNGLTVTGKFSFLYCSIFYHLLV